MHQPLKFSVIVPTLNCERCLPQCLKSIRKGIPQAEVIVVDGNSHDRTQLIARQEGAKVFSTQRGRGYQLNKGIENATGDILLFLHADTILPDGAAQVLNEYFRNPAVQIGTFALTFDYKHWLLDFYARMTKFDSFWTKFGDQCIVVRQSFLSVCQGFPKWPILEDVHFLQKARKVTTIYSFPRRVITSARKFVEHGYVRQQIRNGYLLLQYLLGVSPEIIYKKYYSA